MADETNAVLNDESELTMPDGTLYGREFWGISRHKLIAGAAEQFLTDRARTEVERILAPIETVSLADVAGWADQIKRRRPDPNRDDADTVDFLEDRENSQHGTWHYVNLPHGVEDYSREDYPQFTRDNDVVQMIKECVRVLKGDSDRFSERNA
ncbi:MAG: hypothetical protein LC778_09870, partial [Acidobacteria bacterium]|nr:hypothetical protein [Acidobacteriota bacterium]